MGVWVDATGIARFINLDEGAYDVSVGMGDSCPCEGNPRSRIIIQPDRNNYYEMGQPDCVDIA
jgi:hypothetical protein